MLGLLLASCSGDDATLCTAKDHRKIEWSEVCMAAAPGCALNQYEHLEYRGAKERHAGCHGSENERAGMRP